MFNGVLAGDDIKSIMNKGLGKELGIASIELTGKLTVTWGSIKAR
jgi:hypothetical protein